MAYDKEAWRASHENGKIALAELARVDPIFFDADLGGAAMAHPEAAAAMSAMFAAALADGRPFRIIYSYRTFAVQEVKWANFQAGGNLAAQPGTSNHGWAVAFDLGGLTSEVLAWLRNNARRFGFVNDVPSEDWHWTYYENIWTPPPPGQEDDEMYRKFKQGWKDYTAALREKNGVDPGEAPKGWDDEDRIFGWNASRFAANNPKPVK